MPLIRTHRTGPPLPLKTLNLLPQALGLTSSAVGLDLMELHFIHLETCLCHAVNCNHTAAFSPCHPSWLNRMCLLSYCLMNDVSITSAYFNNEWSGK